MMEIGDRYRPEQLRCLALARQHMELNAGRTPVAAE
ncbi:hypothetical protein KL86PLE_30544 [uncultured Pleomorphomonas sp.]|uniref:Uncharacterized protein n=1 Tax=uncultured Pleomorphomonas sp. TaxID=442121 RepID=A0A212LF54_9HYPH|nr:hypothetical protein KL86PLE_30544 [uncultured Pleomorphomonas sp.]